MEESGEGGGKGEGGGGGGRLVLCPRHLFFISFVFVLICVATLQQLREKRRRKG